MSEPRTQIQPELWVSDEQLPSRSTSRRSAPSLSTKSPGRRPGHHRSAVGRWRTFWLSNASTHMRRFSPDAIEGATGRLLLVADDPESLLAAAVAAGAAQISPVGEEHGWSLGRFKDPFGHDWEVGRLLIEWPPSPG